MLRKFLWVFLALLLTACTLAPDVPPTPVVCPTCAAAPTCPSCLPTSTPAAKATAPVAATATIPPLPTITETVVIIPTETFVPTLPIKPSPEQPSPTPVSTLPVKPSPEQPSPTPVSTLPVEPSPVQPSPTPVSTLVPGIYSLQSGTPRLLQNFNHPERGCAWMGVAGQVFASDRTPVTNIVVLAKGSLNGLPVEAIGLTGSAPAYGPGGFELELADQPVETQGVFSVQLFDLLGVPISEPLPFDTHSDCKNNLILVNFSAGNP